MATNKKFKIRNFSSYLANVDKINPLEFEAKKNFFYENADIIIDSSNGIDEKKYLDIIESKFKNITENNSKQFVNQKSQSIVAKVKKMIKSKYQTSSSFIKNSINQQNLIHTQTSFLNCHNLTISQKNKELRKKNGMELFQYFNSDSNNPEHSQTGNTRSQTVYNITSPIEMVKTSGNNEIMSTLNSVHNFSLNESKNKSKINFNATYGTFSKMQSSKIKRKIFSENIYNCLTEKNVKKRIKLNLSTDSKKSNGNCQTDMRFNQKSQNKNDIENKDLLKEVESLNKSNKSIEKNQLNLASIQRKYRNQNSEDYKKLAKMFESAEKYENLFGKIKRKNQSYIEKIDEYIKKDEIKIKNLKKSFGELSQDIKNKTHKLKNHSNERTGSSYFDKKTKEIKVHNLKTKFKVIGNFKILVIPKALKNENLNQENKILKVQRLKDSIHNLYDKEKTTNLKIKRNLEILAKPKSILEKSQGNYILDSLIKTCDFIEDENILQINKIKKTHIKSKKNFENIDEKTAFMIK